MCIGRLLFLNNELVIVPSPVSPLYTIPVPVLLNNVIVSNVITPSLDIAPPLLLNDELDCVIVELVMINVPLLYIPPPRE